MIQNAKLFDILQIPNQLLFQYQELNNFKYLQYLGTQPSLTIISSLIHYSFIQKFDRFTSLILEFQFYSKESKLIQKQLNQSYKSENPIKEFFQDYFLYQDKANNLNEFMVQLCQGMNWLDNKTINLTKIAIQLQITFIILPERKIYGLENNQQKIILYFNNDQIFFVIPLQLQENYNRCQLCRKPCKQYYGKTKCGHSIYCTQCLQKPQFQTYVQCARCNSRTLKPSIQLLQDERILYETYLKFYRSRIDQSQQGIIYNQPQQNQVQLEQQQNLCDKCEKPEELVNHFVFVDCGHQFCYQCLKKCENQSYSKLFISCAKCSRTCSKSEVDQYNEFYESAYSQPSIEKQSKCSQCLKDSDYELFKVKKCNHQFCFDCVNAKIRNLKYKSSYLSCLLLKCNELCDYEDCFNYFKMITQKKIDESQNKIIKDQNLQQSIKQEFCQSCYQIFPFDLFEVKQCHHKFCTKCIQRFLANKECFCPSSNCMQRIKKTEYEEYIQKLQNFSKQGMQEATKKDNQSSKNAVVEEKSFDQTLEKTKSISQNQELIANKTVGTKQNQLLKQNLTEKDLKVETNNEQKKNETQKESKKEFDAKQLDQTNKIQKNELKQQQPISEQKQEIKQEIKGESKNENHSDESTKNSLPSSDNPLVKKDSKEDSSQDSIKIQQLDNKSKNLQKDQPDQKYKNLAVINQDEWIEEDSLDTIVIEQMQEFDKQEKEETKGQCTYCSQDFSVYNRKQQVECTIHKIGVCCMLLPYQKCPQCEIVNFKLKHSKAKLNIPKIPLEIGYLFDETLPYPTKLYQKIEMDKTHIRQSDYNARNNLHTSAQRSSTTDYMQNSRFGSVDNRLNQQLISQHQRYEPRKENYYEPTILSNHKPVIMSRQTQQIYRQPQPYSYNLRYT